METIAIHTEFIKLQDLLKFAGSTGTGGEGKNPIPDGQGAGNGGGFPQRGKKLRPGGGGSPGGRGVTGTPAEQ